MATTSDMIEYLLEQLGGAQRGVTARKMFGEYGLYCEGKFFGLVCDGSLYLKPTDAAKALLAERGELHEAPAYEGARHSLRMDCVEDRELLAQALRLTLDALPLRKPTKRSATPLPRQS